MSKIGDLVIDIENMLEEGWNTDEDIALHLGIPVDWVEHTRQMMIRQHTMDSIIDVIQDIDVEMHITGIRDSISDSAKMHLVAVKLLHRVDNELPIVANKQTKTDVFNASMKLLLETLRELNA